MHPSRLTPWRRKSTAAAIVGVTVFGGLVSSHSLGAKGKESDRAWEAPARASRKENPRPADEDSIRAGRAVYIAECLDCHGKRGAGDGPGARDLRRRPPDLAGEPVQRQSDGALFWKITEGRKEMPGYDEDLLSEEQRWNVTNYMRTLAPEDASAAGAGRGKEAK